MRSRGDPERIYQAQRAGILRRLVDDERVPEAKANALIAAWERATAITGAERESPLYWDFAWDWIAERRKP